MLLLALYISHYSICVTTSELQGGGIPLPTHRKHHERENEVINQTPLLLFIPHKVTADVCACRFG